MDGRRDERTSERTNEERRKRRSQRFGTIYNSGDTMILAIIFIALPMVAARASPDDKTETRSQLTAADVNTVLVPAVVFLQLGLLGCFFVLFRTFLKWRQKNYAPLPMSLRLPFYTALTDLFIDVVFTVNMVYTIRNRQTWPEPQCGVIGLFTFMTICMNAVLFLAISVNTYLRVCRRKYFDAGTYDYKLHLSVLMISVLFSAPLYPGHVYGAKLYWCNERHGRTIVSYIFLAMMIIIMGTTLFCYINILSNISASKKKIANIPHRVSITVGTGLRASRLAKKISSYMLVWLLQWVPVFIYVIGAGIYGSFTRWPYGVAGIAISVGGIGNAVIYIVNEGFLHARDSTIGSDNSVSVRHMSPPPERRTEQPPPTIEVRGAMQHVDSSRLVRCCQHT